MDYAGIFRDTNAIILMVLFFGGSIFVHELGHFLFAKWRGLKVLRFSIGFGPRLFSWKGKDGCIYAVSLLPFGGYVSIPQLANMKEIEGGAEEEELKDLPPISYFDKVSVSFAGALFNILFAFVLAVFVYFLGVPTSASNKSNVVGYVPETINITGVEIPSSAFKAGIMAGDKILKIDDDEVSDFADIFEKIALGSGRTEDGQPEAKITIERNGKVFDTRAVLNLVKTNLRTGDEIRMLGIYPQTSMKVSNVMDGTPAMRAGVKIDDEIKSIDGIAVYSVQQMLDYLSKLEDNTNINLKIVRDGNEIEISVLPVEIVKTRPLCDITLPDNDTISFINPVGKGEAAVSTSTEGTLKILKLSHAENLQAGDMLVQANGKDISNLMQLNTIVNHTCPDRQMKLSFYTGSSLKEFILPQKTSAKIIEGLSRKIIGCEFAEKKIIVHPGIYDQFKDNLVRTWNSISSLVNPKSDIGLKHLSGPVGIGRAIYKFSLMDFSMLLSFMVLININLAILNLLPIPVLDGGHILIATISKLIRREIPSGVVAVLQGTFILLFFAMMIYVVYFDVMRWTGDNEADASIELMSEYYLPEPIYKK